ncbi:hypothetical protein [uncultured Mediterranean phage]|nr:hypothetical protein [uncultured Mediterranean phage]
MDMSEMTVKSLKGQLLAKGIEPPKKAKKSELIAILAATEVSEAAADERAAAAATPAQPTGPTLWAEVDDTCMAWVKTMCMQHRLDEQDVVRGMLYCAFNAMHRQGLVRSQRAITNALKDTTHRGSWI